MKLVEFRYERKFNLGDYESEIIGFVYHLDDEEEKEAEELIHEAQVLAKNNSTLAKRKKQGGS